MDLMRHLTGPRGCILSQKPTPPKPPRRPSFGSWQPSDVNTPTGQFLDRAAFNGVSPEDAAQRCDEFLRQANETLREPTRYNKKVSMARMLRDFAARGKDLASITTEDCAAYRAYLKELHAKGILSEDSCSGMVRVWNSVMRACFGEKGAPGEGVLLKNFKQHAKRVQRLSEEDMARLLEISNVLRFQWDHNRHAFKTYLEVAWATGARVGSILRLAVKDIDWDRQVLLLRHMKNMSEPHEAILTPRATLALRNWCEKLRGIDCWDGAETPLFVNPKGTRLTNKWLNDTLKAATAAAGIHKLVTTHVLRKSAGTLIGRENPKFAQLQLGISAEVFNRHYNQPMVEDRMAKRDILPGSNWKPKTPEEEAGNALLEFMRGRKSREEFDAQVARAQMLKAQPDVAKEHDPSYT
jgi:site-specific recombinase XerD